MHSMSKLLGIKFLEKSYKKSTAREVPKEIKNYSSKKLNSEKKTTITTRIALCERKRYKSESSFNVSL